MWQVVTPLVLLCSEISSQAELSQDDLTDLFDNPVVEEDVLPLMETAM